MPDTGSTVNLSKEAWLTVLPNGSDTEIIQRDIYKTKEEAKASVGAVKVDDGTTDYEMYAWDNDGTVIWWSDAEYVYLPEDSSELFANHPNLKEFDFTYFKVDNVCDFYNIFQGCQSLDVTIKDTTFNTPTGDISDYPEKHIPTYENQVKTAFELKSLSMENCTIVFTNLFKNCIARSNNTATLKLENVDFKYETTINIYEDGPRNVKVRNCKDNVYMSSASCTSESIDTLTIENTGFYSGICAKTISLKSVEASGGLVYALEKLEVVNCNIEAIQTSRTSNATWKEYLDDCVIENSIIDALIFEAFTINYRLYIRNSTISRLDGALNYKSYDSIGGLLCDMSNSTIKSINSGTVLNYDTILFNHAKVGGSSKYSIFQMGKAVKYVNFYNTTFLGSAYDSTKIGFENMFNHCTNLKKVSFLGSKISNSKNGGKVTTLNFQNMFNADSFTELEYLDLSPLFEDGYEYNSINLTNMLKGNFHLKYLGLNGMKATDTTKGESTLFSTVVSSSSVEAIDVLEMRNCKITNIVDSSNICHSSVGVLDLTSSTFKTKSSKVNFGFLSGTNSMLLENTVLRGFYGVFREKTKYSYSYKYTTTPSLDYGGILYLNGADFDDNSLDPVYAYNSYSAYHFDLSASHILSKSTIQKYICADYLKLPNPENFGTYNLWDSTSKIQLNGMYQCKQLDLSNQVLKDNSTNDGTWWNAFVLNSLDGGTLESVITTKELGVPTWLEKWYTTDSNGNVIEVSFGDEVEDGTVLYTKKSYATSGTKYSYNSMQNLKTALALENSRKQECFSYISNMPSVEQTTYSYDYTVKAIIYENGEKKNTTEPLTLQVYNSSGNVVGTVTNGGTIALPTEKYTATAIEYPEKIGMKATVTSQQNGRTITVYLNYSEYTSVTANKIWNDAGLESERPEYITAMLYKNGEAIKAQKLNANNNWTYTWEGLTKSEASNGSVVKNEYSIKEIIPDEYISKYETSESKKNYAYGNEENSQDISVKVEWKMSTNDIQNNVFSKISHIRLYANGEEVDDVLLQMYGTSSENIATFYSKPIRDDNGNKIKYTIKQDEIENCTTSITDFYVFNSFQIPDNTYHYYNYNTIDYLVRVLWTGDYVKDGKLDENLIRSGGYQTVQVSVNNQTHTEIASAKYAKKLDDSTYYNDIIFEISALSFVSSSKNEVSASETSKQNNGFVETREIKQKNPTYFEIIKTGYTANTTHTITVSKTYTGDEKENHPENITIYALTNHGTVTIGTMDTPNVENNTAEFEFPNYYNDITKTPYVITGITEDSKTLSNWVLSAECNYSENADKTFGFDTFSLTNDSRKTYVTIHKKWEGTDAENQYQKLSLELVGSYLNGNGEKKTFTYPFVWELNENTQISETEFETKLLIPCYAKEHWYDSISYPVNYESIQEKESPSYLLIDTNCSKKGTTDEENGYDYFELTNRMKTTSYVVKKVWNILDEEEKKDSVTVNLCLGTNVKNTQTLSEDNNWTYTWETTGDYGTYNVKEHSYDGYVANYETTSIIDENDESHKIVTTVITNTPAKTISVTKVWDDLSNVAGKRKDAKLSFYANGDTTKVVSTLNLDSNYNTYSSTVSLPKYDENGVEIKYSVAETSVPDGYTSSVEGDEENGYQITNYYRPPTFATINIAKYWYDDNSSSRPKEAEFKVYANGVYTGRNITVSASDGWIATDDEHFYYLDENNEPIVYSLEEVEIAGYSCDSIYNFEKNDIVKNFTFRNRSGTVNLWQQIVNIINTPKKYKVGISKQVSGEMANPDEYFEFNVNIDNGEPNGEITVNLANATIITDEFTNPLTYTLDENGEGSFSVYLKHGETISLEEIRRHTNVTVTEVNNPYNVVSELNYKSTTISGSESVSISDMYDDATITYMNAVPNGKNLVISKTVEGNMGNKSKEFQFAVQLPEQYANQKILYAKTGDEVLHIGSVDENAKFNFSLMHEEQIKIVGISEADALEIASNENYGVAENDYSLEGYSTTYECNTDENSNLSVSVTNIRASGVPTGNHVSTGVMATFGVVLIGLAFVLRKKIFKS